MNVGVLPQTFIGRDEVMRVLDKRVTALKSGFRQNVALVGQKLCGKTTILQYFLSRLNDTSLLPIYIEVLPEPFFNFARKFVGTAIFNLLKISGEETVEDLDLLITKGRKRFPQTTQAICDILKLLEKKEYDESYSMLFNLASTIKKETGKSCIIILDEFHNLANFELKKPFVIFGKKIMVQKDTMYIVTSSQVSSIKKILRERLSLLFGNFETIVVRDFDYQRSKEFIRLKLGESAIPEELRDFLIDFTNGRPFYLDIITARLKDAMNELVHKRIDNGLISYAFQDLLFDTKGSLNQYFQNLLSIFLDRQYPDSYLDILTAICEGRYKFTSIQSYVSHRRNRIRRNIEELLDACIISKNGSRFYFDDKIFEFWFKYVFNRRRYSLVTNIVESSNLFKNDVSEWIERFISVCNLDLVHRIDDLISVFDNDIIHIDEKSIRFPKFKRIKLAKLKNGDFYIQALYGDDKSWLFQYCNSGLNENSVLTYIERFKEIDPEARCKVLINLKGYDENTLLIAKQNKVWMWDINILNQILFLYKKHKILGL